ncbi:cytochrome d ubiquinol oxidase subunit II [Duffyella gerundensis]|jgi:cytochrome d ubiquinol oxidase subunit II|uniref:Ubiquinol oxidase subunit II, cyanide insensitive n=1 Tax=Duffyella gerundensis TaxID=1619313 RepID=A0A0U5L7Q2_9GAMM|nr:cytochrome d ubiquinol oxidase subunit II [Duffyella gerundensis]UCB29990.1 cytochrome d ubiquinol oxidase subunit II [Duffyella gerundensis]CUU25179.1 ubiquinol oxidase subunit II, cyanide insensitive [Duffyella gerundensis]
MGIDLSIIWFTIIVFSTLMYIVMDGFDLGIGILFPFNKDAVERDMMVNTVAPVWDGNETWLVLGGAALYGAFPLAYAVIADALAIPLTVMLFGLIFRGVAFEFRFKATVSHRAFWDKSFIFGSVVATFSQGVAVGAILNGFPVVNRTFAGSALDWLAPFPLFCGVGLVLAYALLGATWLIMKTDNALHQKMSKLVPPLLLALLAAIAVISIWTPLSHASIAHRWFTLPNLFWFLPVPVLVVLCAWGLLKAVKRHAHYTPFLLTLALIFLGFTGLGISIWPNIIPPSISIWDAASPPQSQGFMLVGGLLIIPVILCYTFWSYYVFRGKITPDEGYH